MKRALMEVLPVLAAGGVCRLFAGATDAPPSVASPAPARAAASPAAAEGPASARTAAAPGTASPSAAAQGAPARPAPTTAAEPPAAPVGPPQPVPQAELMAELARAPQRSTERAAEVVALFKQAGVKDVTRQAIRPPRQGIRPGENIVATLPGQTDETIIVGAHYDCSAGSPGVIDNWTGVVCMTNLAQALANSRPRRTLVFVAFDLEEQGRAGSRWFVAQLPQDARRRVTAMVNLECLGVSGLKVWLTGSADALEQLADAVARRERVAVEFRQLYGVTSDSDSFMRAGLAAITFDSLDQADFKLINSPKDRIDAVRPETFEEQYRYILRYVQALDARVGPISPANKDRPPPPAP